MAFIKLKTEEAKEAPLVLIVAAPCLSKGEVSFVSVYPSVNSLCESVLAFPLMLIFSSGKFSARLSLQETKPQNVVSNRADI